MNVPDITNAFAAALIDVIMQQDHDKPAELPAATIDSLAGIYLMRAGLIAG